MSRSKTDVGQKGLLVEGPRGRKDADGQEVVISVTPLKKALADLLNLKAKADTAKDRLNDAVKAIAKQTRLMASVVNKLVKAKSGDDFEDEKRKVDQASLVFGEFAGELPEPPVAHANGNGNGEADADPFKGSPFAQTPPEGMTDATLANLDAAGQDAAASAKRKAERIAAAH